MGRGNSWGFPELREVLAWREWAGHSDLRALTSQGAPWSSLVTTDGPSLPLYADLCPVSVLLRREGDPAGMGRQPLSKRDSLDAP